MINPDDSAIASKFKESRTINHAFGLQRAVNSRIHNDRSVPVYKAPTDILIEIISQIADNSRNPSVIEPLRFEVIASHISQRWRDAAISSRLLWSSIRMQVRATNRESALAHLKARLERSDPALLDIYLEMKIEGDALEQEFYQLLASHSKRWKSLSIVTASDYSVDIAHLLSTTTVPHLQHFSLSVGWLPVFGIEPAEIRLYRSNERLDPVPIVPSFICPNLSVVRLGGWARWKIIPPLANITTLHLSTCRKFMEKDPPSPLQDLINSAPRLLHLSITDQKIFFNGNGAYVEVELHNLQSLRLIHCDPFQFVSRISMPKLHSLTLSHCVTDVRYNTSSFLEEPEMLATVEHLILNRCLGKGSTVIQMFQNLSSVRVLTLNGGDSLPAVLKALSKPLLNSNSLPLPQLSTIEIFNLSSQAVDPLVNMLHARTGDFILDELKLDTRSKVCLRKADKYDWITSQMWSAEDTDGEAPSAWPSGFKYNNPREKLHWDSLPSPRFKDDSDF